METVKSTVDGDVRVLASEVRRMMREIDEELRVMKEPWSASTGEKRVIWQRMIDRKLDSRHELRKLLKEPVAK